MKITSKSVAAFCLVMIVLVLISPTRARASVYQDQRAMEDHLQRLAERQPDLVRVAGMGRSHGGRDLWLVEIGRGPNDEREHRPAMLVVAGVEGADLLGSAVAVGWIEQLVERYNEDEAMTRLLETTTIYVVPRLNPDAAERYFLTPLRETNVNPTPVDEDHDGLTDEDGPDDLNRDGIITHMRVRDDRGKYALDPNDDRLLVEADPLEEESGTWRLLPEGVDDDGDGRWNEDGPGGVNLNRNFPFDYEHAASDAGTHAVSEIETRALADFVVAHPNIALVVTYGPTDNLLKCPESSSPPGRRNPLTKIDEDDVGYYRTLGKQYREMLGLKKEIETPSHPGTFSDWMYFHRGRFSAALCAWNPDIAIAKSNHNDDDDEETDPNEADEIVTEDENDEKKGEDKDEEDKRNKEQRRQLKWFDEHAPEMFVSWLPYDHPDFPGQRVEIGGYRPFALTVPRASVAAGTVESHAGFLTAMITKLPRIGVREIEVDHLGNDVYELEICVENTGFLPTVLSHGRRTREVHPTRVTLDVDDPRLLSGQRITNLPAIAGSGGTARVRYVVHAPDRDAIEFSVVSALGGRVADTAQLLKDR